jgi:hypothetical protein
VVSATIIDDGTFHLHVVLDRAVNGTDPGAATPPWTGDTDGTPVDLTLETGLGTAELVLTWDGAADPPLTLVIPEGADSLHTSGGGIVFPGTFPVSV